MIYRKYLPSGNTTILVEKYITDFDKRKKINDKLLKKYKDVEQIGFIDKKNKRLLMAGGEFCGNATRCAVFNILKGRPGDIIIEICNNRLNAGIDKNKNVWTDIPHLCW